MRQKEPKQDSKLWSAVPQKSLETGLPADDRDFGEMPNQLEHPHLCTEPPRVPRI